MNYSLLKTTAIFLEKTLPLLGTMLIFRANVLLFIRNQQIINLEWFWASITSAILLVILYINLKDLRLSIRGADLTVDTPKYYVIANLAFIAFLILSFQNMVTIEYFPPVGAFESVIYSLLAGYLLYISKLTIDCGRLLLPGSGVRFYSQLYALFACFFITHGLWIVTQPNFEFVDLKNRTMIATLLVKTLSPGDEFLGHKSFVLGSTDAPYGHLVYQPENESGDQQFPLLIFLHGGDETGNSKEQHVILSRAAKHGPSRLIKYGQWNPPTPIIVVSPQTTDGWWRPRMLHAFIEYLIDTYPVDSSRIYLTGLSRGGTGSFDYINQYGHNAHVAAMLPMATDAIVRNSGDFLPGNFKDTPVWLFINDQDKYVPDYKATVEIIRQITSTSNGSRVTVYPRRGHDAWTGTYTLAGQGFERADYHPFDTDVYEWLLQHRKRDKPAVMK
jgi:dienelactone hydrolase